MSYAYLNELPQFPFKSALLHNTNSVDNWLDSGLKFNMVALLLTSLHYHWQT